jgi:serine/threonine protein kinase
MPRAGVYVPYIQYNPVPENSPTIYARSIQRRYSGGGDPVDTMARAERIGAILRGIFFHTDYYAPLLSAKGVSTARDSEMEDADAGIPRQTDSKSEYVSIKTRDVGDITLIDELIASRKKSAPFTMAKIVDTHTHLLSAISIMQAGDAQIIHFDLKNSNIRYDRKRRLPVIIGFGISYRFSDIDPSSAESLRKYLYTYTDEYSPWCIDITLLSYIVHQVLTNSADKGVSRTIDDALTEADIKDLERVCEKFSQNNRLFVDGNSSSSETKNVYTPTQVSEFLKKMTDYIKSLQSKTWQQVIVDLLSGWRSWDVYSLCAIYRHALLKLFPNTLPDTSATKSSSFWVSGYIDALDKVLLAPPSSSSGERRASPEEMSAGISSNASIVASTDSAIKYSGWKR